MYLVLSLESLAIGRKPYLTGYENPMYFLAIVLLFGFAFAARMTASKWMIGFFLAAAFLLIIGSIFISNIYEGIYSDDGDFGDRLKEVDILQIEWFFRQYHKDQMRLDKLLPILRKYGFSGFMQKEVFYIDNVPSSCDLIFFRS